MSKTIHHSLFRKTSIADVYAWLDNHPRRTMYPKPLTGKFYEKLLFKDEYSAGGDGYVPHVIDDGTVRNAIKNGAIIKPTLPRRAYDLIVHKKNGVGVLPTP